MATTPKKFSIFFLLLTLSASILQVHARESQFFSKFSNNKPTNTDQPEQQEPITFIPQTQNSVGYGLYGRTHPPSTTTLATTNGGANDNLPTSFPENYNTVAYTTPIHSHTHTQNYNQKQDQFLDNGRYYNMGANMYNSGKQGMGETNFKDTAVDGGNMYNIEKQGMSDTRVLDNEQYYHGNNDMHNNQQGMGGTRFMDRWDSSTTVGGNMYNTEKQGMSDTRFMENGKYYYDLNGESSNANENMMNSRNGYMRRGYYGNNDNSHPRYNSNARFQENQEDVFTP